MTATDTPLSLKLPPGDEDPSLIYVAVGMAIHRWESLEERLAGLALTFQGIPAIPPNLPGFGSRNGIFRMRLKALEDAGARYFVSNPDQSLEGQLASLIAKTNELSIERHRIAHGHITMWGEMQMPSHESYTDVRFTILYRWAPPWYGIDKLKTNPVGMNASGINAISEKFEDLAGVVAKFTAGLKGPDLSP